jgi:hypothetical protein
VFPSSARSTRPEIAIVSFIGVGSLDGSRNS